MTIHPSTNRRSIVISSRLISASLVIAALIHLLPLVGAFGTERLATLYGVRWNDPNLDILMRHRAVLFGLLGALLFYAAFRPALQPLALVAAWLSLSSFLVLAGITGGYNDELRRVVLIDVVTLVIVVGGVAAKVWSVAAPD